MIDKFFTWPFIKCEKGTNMTFNVIKRQLIIILVLERFFYNSISLRKLFKMYEEGELYKI